MKDRRTSKKIFIRYAGMVTLGSLQMMLLISFFLSIVDHRYAQYLSVVIGAQLTLTLTVFGVVWHSDSRKERYGIPGQKTNEGENAC